MRDKHFCKEVVSYSLLGFSDTRGARLRLVFDDGKQFVFWGNTCSVVETVNLRNPRNRIVAEWDGDETVPSRINLTFCSSESYAEFLEKTRR